MDFFKWNIMRVISLLAWYGNFHVKISGRNLFFYPSLPQREGKRKINEGVRQSLSSATVSHLNFLRRDPGFNEIVIGSLGFRRHTLISVIPQSFLVLPGKLDWNDWIWLGMHKEQDVLQQRPLFIMVADL